MSGDTLKHTSERIKELVAAKKEYKNAKDKSNSAYAKYNKIQEEVINILESSELNTFDVPSCAKVTRIDKLVYTTPKDLDSKIAFFTCLSDSCYELNDFVTIHSQTLNRLCNEMTESGVLDIAGLDEPTLRTTLSVRVN